MPATFIPWGWATTRTPNVTKGLPQYGNEHQLFENKMAKKKLTESELEERKTLVSFNRKCAGYRRHLKTIIRESGLRNFKLKLEYLVSNPNTKLPKPFLNHEQTVECWRDAMNEYLGEQQRTPG